MNNKLLISTILSIMLLFMIPITRVVATTEPTDTSTQSTIVDTPDETDYINEATEHNTSIPNDNPQASPDIASSILDISSLVISWSGWALAFLTILSTFLGLWGFHELNDLRKARAEIQGLQTTCKGYEDKLKELDKQFTEKIENLSVKYESDANKIMLATYFYVSGTNAYIKSQYAEAIQMFKKSLQYAPTNTDSMCYLGRAYNFLGERDKSYNCFQDALKVDSNCSEAYRGLAAWYRHSDLGKALENAKRAADLAQDDYEIQNYLGQLYRDAGMINEAMAIYLKSLMIRPHPDTEFFLSILYAANNEMRRARVHIENAIDQYDNDDEFVNARPVWKTMAHWVYAILRKDYVAANKYLDIVVSQIDSGKTKKVVWGHISFLLSAVKADNKFVCSCKKKVGI